MRKRDFINRPLQIVKMNKKEIPFLKDKTFIIEPGKEYLKLLGPIGFIEATSSNLFSHYYDTYNFGFRLTKPLESKYIEKYILMNYWEVKILPSAFLLTHSHEEVRQYAQKLIVQYENY